MNVLDLLLPKITYILNIQLETQCRRHSADSKIQA
jgi:hypothetical protein